MNIRTKNQRSQGRCRVGRLVSVVPALLFACSAPAAAKCAIGVLTLTGETTAAIQRPITLTVTLETPKGPFTHSSTVTGPRFTIDARFNTFSSSFMPFWTERCNNRPKGVVVAAERNGNR